MNQKDIPNLSELKSLENLPDNFILGSITTKSIRGKELKPSHKLLTRFQTAFSFHLKNSLRLNKI